jgi:hypothetical protein
MISASNIYCFPGPTTSSPVPGVSPNGPAVDGAIMAIAHEVIEAITDPEMDGYYTDDTYLENMDLCNFKPGTLYNDSGITYNLVSGGRKYFVQNVGF